mgnify:CR=1 FL=1
MKNAKWTKLMALSLALLMPLVALGETPFGAAALSEGKTYTVEEMLTYAIQDEYLARAEYKVIMDAYGEQRPFINIMKAEGVHVQRLLPLFTAYGVTVPEDTALEHTVKPDSLQAAYEAGVTAEVHNIAMYEAFLKQEDLPDDVRVVFDDDEAVALIHEAVQHLDQLRLAMADIVGAAVQMHVDEPAPVHVVKVVALAPVDDEVDIGVLPELGLARIPVLQALLDEFLLGGALLGLVGHLASPQP